MAARKRELDDAMKSFVVELENLKCQIQMLADEAEYERHEKVEFSRHMRNILNELSCKMYSGETDALTELKTRVKALEIEKSMLVGALRKHGIDDYVMNEWEADDARTEE